MKKSVQHSPKKSAWLPVLCLCLACLFASVLTLTVSAEETVIYENDFSSASLSDFHLYKNGTWIVENGRLKTKGSGTSTFLSYEIPAEYEGLGYRVEVDMYDISSMGGILIGATADTIAGKTPSYFYGYTCTTVKGTVTANTEKAYIGYFSETGGWGGNFPPSTQPIPAHSDVHLSVSVQKGVMTYRVTTLDGSEQLYGIRYEIGDAEGDFYTDFTRTVGLRDYYNDTAAFDNLKITVIADDPIPAPEVPVTFCGIAGKADSTLAFDSGRMSGSGNFLSDESLSGCWTVRASVAVEGKTYAFVGAKTNGSGYAVVLDPDERKISVHRILNNQWTCLGEKMTPIRESACELRIESTGTVLSVWYDNLYQGNDAFPKFEFNIVKLTGAVGFTVNGSVSDLSFGANEPIKAADNYINPVCWGADPDMLYYEGTYYLYNKVDDSHLFRVYTSPDLVHWTTRNYIFDPSSVPASSGIDIKSSWSPNVFYNEGIFYLIFAAHPTNNSDTRHLYYATSESPTGPFTMKTYEPINPNVREIDGHPYRDDDGKIYLSCSRYDEGGTVWFQEATFKDGVITRVGEAHRVASADREWDTDGYIRLCEGGGFYKHNGLYYLIYCTGSYARHYGEAVAVSDNVFGPYVKSDYNPFLIYNAELDGPGDALILPSPDGEELWLIYHRHNAVGDVSPRQTCIDKIEFVPDPDGGPDILTVHGPTNTLQTAPSHKYRYDVDRDGSITPQDAVCIRQYIAGEKPYTGFYDVNADGVLDDEDAKAVEAVMDLKGDFDRDGRIGNPDVALLIRYLAGWKSAISANALADITGDGKVNNRDAIQLIQSVAGWASDLPPASVVPAEPKLSSDRKIYLSNGAKGDGTSPDQPIGSSGWGSEGSGGSINGNVASNTGTFWDAIKNGGTAVAVGKCYVGTTWAVYPTASPLLFTAKDGDTDYLSRLSDGTPDLSQTPGQQGMFMVLASSTVTFMGDVIFDDIVLLDRTTSPVSAGKNTTTTYRVAPGGNMVIGKNTLVTHIPNATENPVLDVMLGGVAFLHAGGFSRYTGTGTLVIDRALVESGVVTESDLDAFAGIVMDETGNELFN